MKSVSVTIGVMDKRIVTAMAIVEHSRWTLTVAKDKGSYPKITVTVSDLEPAFWMKNFNSWSVSQATCSCLGLLPAVRVFFWIVAEDICQLQRRLLQSRAIERGNAPSANQMHRTHTHRTEPATQNSRNTLGWRNVWDFPRGL